MKLKNLFTCTVTGLLLCTSCIKDEAPNAEADLLNCILPAEMLTGTDIDYNRPYDKSLNAYPIYIEVNNGTDLTRLAPTFELTEGASIEPASGSTQNFTNPVRYTVTSEDKNWHRTYAINIHYPETKSIPTVFNFENVKTVPYNKNEYYVLYEAASGYSTLTWSSGNQGFALTGSGYAPNDFPTSISPNGRTGNCLQLITRETGSLGTLVGMPIAAGNLFIGSFDIGSAMSDALSATKFGTTFYYEPIKLVGYYKYKAGPKFYENGEYTNRKDVFNIYALFYEKTKDVQMLDGHITKNNYEHENMVADMKKYILTLILALASLGLYAQTNRNKTIINAALHGWEYEIKAGVNLGGTAPLPFPEEIRSIDGYNPTLSITIEGNMTKWLDSKKKMGDHHWTAFGK